MNLVEGIRIALAALAANKMRSALTTLGVVIGVGAVIAMVALGNGAQKDVQDRINKLGSNLLYVTPGQAQAGNVFRAFGSADTLTIDEAMELKKEVSDAAGVAPEISSNVQVKYHEKNGNFRLTGTFPDYSFVRNIEFKRGRFFNSLEFSGRRQVCAIGSSIYDNLFAGKRAIGQRIKVKGVSFTIVGVVAERGGYGREDENIYIPLTVMRQRLSNTKYVRLIAVTGKEGVSVDQLTYSLRRYFRRHHRLRPGQADDFGIMSQGDILSTFQETGRIFTMLLGGIASISLLVGGIGIMNIMLVTVTERTREIGIRKALGARRRDIQLQFVIESTVLSVIGGLMGVTLGLFLAWISKSKFGLSSYVSVSSVVVAFGCAASIGIFFGWYPASRAGKLDPIQALRYE